MVDLPDPLVPTNAQDVPAGTCVENGYETLCPPGGPPRLTLHTAMRLHTTTGWLKTEEHN